jgi:hypothetical protein
VGKFRVRTAFGDFEVTLDPPAGTDVSAREQSMLELRALLRNSRHYQPEARKVVVELHRRLLGAVAWWPSSETGPSQAATIARDLEDAAWTGRILVRRTEGRRIAVPLASADDDVPALGPVEETYNVEFVVTDNFDDPFPGLEYVLLYPDGRRKTGKLGEDGKVADKSVPPGSYQLALKIVSTATWRDRTVELGKPVGMAAVAAGFDPGTPGTFEIFDGRAVDKAPIATTDGSVNGSHVLEGTWTPDKDSLKDATAGELVFRAKIGASNAVSAPVPVFEKHSFELEDDDGPLGDTLVVARFSDGHEVSEQAKGGKLDVLVPIGQKLLWVDLPDHPGAHLTLQEEGADPRDYLLWESSDEASGEGDDGGSEGPVDEDDADDDEDDEDDEDDDEDDQDDEADDDEDEDNGDGDDDSDGGDDGEEDAEESKKAVSAWASS